MQKFFSSSENISSYKIKMFCSGKIRNTTQCVVNTRFIQHWTYGPQLNKYGIELHLVAKLVLTYAHTIQLI